MVIKKQLIPVIFNQTLQTDADPKITQSGLLRAENVRIKYKGNLTKRDGGTSLVGTYGDGLLTTFKNKPYYCDDQLYAYNSDTQTFEIVDKVPNCDIEFSGISSSSGDYIYQQEIVESDDIRVVVYSFYSIVYEADKGIIKTFNIHTGQQIDEKTIDLPSYSEIRVVKNSSKFCVFYFNKLVDDLEMNPISGTGEILSEFAWEDGPSPYVSIDFFRHLDAISLPNDTTILSFITDELNLAIATFDEDFALTDNDQTISLQTGGVMSMFAWKDDYAGICWTDSGSTWADAYALIVEDDLTFLTDYPSIYNLDDFNDRYFTKIYGTQYDTDEFRVYAEVTDDTKTYPAWTTSIYRMNCEITIVPGDVDTISVSSSGFFVNGQFLQSYPFVDSDGYEYIITTPGILQPAYYNQMQFQVIRRDLYDGYAYLVGKSAFGSAIPNIPSKVVETSTKDVFRTSLITAIDYNTHTISAFDIDLTAKPKSIVETRDSLCISGSIPSVYDGQTVFEQGFNQYPYLISAGQSAGEGLDAPSTYGYIATYEWTDSNGKLYRSAPSPVDTVITNTGFGQVEVIVPTYTLTEKEREALTISLWRTEGYGNLYHLVETKYNPILSSSITFTDSSSDATILSNEILYTDGGLIENIVPPQYRVSCIHDNRLFIVNRDSESTDIRYTKVFNDYDGISHSDFFTITVSSNGGKITALKSFIDRLIIFKEDRIYGSYGDGLNDFGIGAGYAKPSLIYSQLGCVDQNLITEVPDGLMFVAKDDQIYLLTRNLQVTSIGSPVKYYLDNQTLTSCYSDPINSEAVYFSEDADGYALVYNWDFKQWTMWSDHDAYSCIISNDLRYFNRKSTNEIIVNSSDYRNPDYTYLHTNIRTCWYSFTNLMGFSRIKRILLVGNNISAHTVRVKIAYDMDPYFVDNFTYDTDNILSTSLSEYFGSMTNSLNANQAEILEISGSRQKCTSIMLNISDEDNNGCGLEIIGLVFEVGMKQGPFRLGETQGQLNQGSEEYKNG